MSEMFEGIRQGLEEALAYERGEIDLKTSFRSNDLISREALLELYADTEDIKFDAYNVPIPVVRQNIKDMPAVDAVEVVHATWELKHIGHGHYWECSACHTNPCIYVTENTKFCPNCGARMDGE